MPSRAQADEKPDGAQVDGLATTAIQWARRHISDLVAALLAAVVSLVGAIISTGARSENLSVMWASGDLPGYYAAAKGMIENGWWTPNPALGYPTVQDFSSFPTPDLLSFWALKVITVVTQNPIASVNAYFLLTFPAVAVSAYLLFRICRINPWIAAILATSLALVPWHFERLVHLFLANYSMLVMGLVMVAIVMRGTLDRPMTTWRSRGALTIAICAALIAGFGGTYYAVFTTLIATAVLGAQFLAGRSIRTSFRSILIVTLTPITFSVSLIVVTFGAPNVTRPIGRSPIESEFFAGEFYSLFRVSEGNIGSRLVPHRLADLPSRATDAFEGDAFGNLLSVVAVTLTCVLLLMTLAAAPRVRARGSQLLESVKPWLLIFVVSTAFFTTTALGVLFSTIVGPQIRTWGRMAPVVFAASFVVLGICLTTWWVSRRLRVLAVAVLIAMGAITVFDPFVGARPIDMGPGMGNAQNLEAYVSTAEARLAENCPVMELPALFFPEVPRSNRANPYDGLLPYIYSSDLRWSYGALKYTQDGQWAVDVAQFPVREHIAVAREKGFCAIQFDKYALAESDTRADQAIAPYARLLGEPIAQSPNGRWVMFSLAE